MVTDDSILTHEGLAPIGTSGAKVLIIGCGAIAREILAVKEANGWEHLDLTCLPAKLHNHPERITPAVEAAVDAHRDNYSDIFIAYADCGTGGQLQAACDRLGVEMIEGPHCYAFFEGVDTFAARDEIDAFYLTDFLVRQFDAFVWKPLGLDRHPELLPMYFEHYRTLVYQAQVEDPALDALAEQHAQRMGLTYERRFTGFGGLAQSLAPAAAKIT